MDFLLAIDTTSPTASLSLFNCADQSSGHEIATKEFESTRSVDTTLFSPLAEILTLLDGKKLNTILIGTGPGSYNGARAGIAAAQALSLSHQGQPGRKLAGQGQPGRKPAGQGQLIGLPSFLAHPQALTPEETHFIGDARRHQYFHLTYANGQPTHEIELLDPNAAKELILSTASEQQATKGSASSPPANLRATEGSASPTSQGKALIAPQPSDDFYFLRDDEKKLIHHQAPHATHLAKAWLSFTEEQKNHYAQKPVDAFYLRPPHITQAKKGHPLLRK